MRRVAYTAVCIAVIAALVPLGRWERDRSLRARNDGVARVRAAIGGDLVNRALTGYRMGDAVDCLLYRSDGVLYRYELCFDASGRVVEAVDRLREPATIWSLEDEPSAARVSVPTRPLFDDFRRIGAFAGVAYPGTLPVGSETAPPQLSGVLRIADIVGTDLGERLAGYRLTGTLACLRYTSGYELCFDARGRLREASDLAHGVAYTTSPANAPARVRVRAVFGILLRLGAVPPGSPFHGVLPVGPPKRS